MYSEDDMKSEDIIEDLNEIENSVLRNVVKGIIDMVNEFQCDGMFDKTVNRDDDEEMISPVTDQVIKVVIFDIKDDKAPGADGFTAKFYKVAWELLNMMCVKLYMSFFC
nr:hypothetical protein [Tanacetum cinerariifolium]